jgi:hypothetical protein
MFYTGNEIAFRPGGIKVKPGSQKSSACRYSISKQAGLDVRD